MTARRTLNLRLFRRVLFGIGLASAALMVAAAATGRGEFVTAAAALFAVSACVVAVLCNIDAWRRPLSIDADADALVAIGALRRNAMLAATAFGWGALAMQGVYVTALTGLKWQHGWQYAAAMAVLGTGWWAFARTLRPALPGAERKGWAAHFRWACPLALGQGLIAAGGLGALVISGKLWSIRADWAANRVFAALAVAILAISIATWVSHRRLYRDGAAR